jgi:galactose mutarotase-like enzyme
MAGIRVHRWRGAAAVTLAAGDLTATFLPDVGMLGTSFTWREHEFLALPGGIAGGHTTGLPLLHPWANRLARRRYVAAGVAVDLRRIDLLTDSNGLPIHGTMLGQAGWTIVSMAGGGRRPRFTARFDYGAPPDLLAAFPFPHVVDVTVALGGGELAVTTTVTPSAGPVPISFGWHPYLRLPGPRSTWRLALPEREELVLNARSIPTGRRVHRAAEDEPIGDRTADVGFALDADGRFAVESRAVRLDVAFDSGYPLGQLWVPPGRRFCCIEPMTAPTNALGADGYALATPEAPYSATYVLRPGSSSAAAAASRRPRPPTDARSVSYTHTSARL